MVNLKGKTKAVLGRGKEAIKWNDQRGTRPKGGAKEFPGGETKRTTTNLKIKPNSTKVKMTKIKKEKSKISTLIVAF